MNINRMADVAALIVTASLLGPAAVFGQSQPALGDLSIEDLLSVRVQPVFGASERLQPVSEAPATVTIITAGDIKRYGYRTLAEILRGVSGLQISDDRNYSYVGVRGVGVPGDYNSRVLLLLNGHQINHNVYDWAPLGAELGIDVAMIDRVEIIRGPASSTYGTSAFFAVINVITRTGASMDGATFDATFGTLGDRTARASFGRRFSQGLDLALSGSVDRSEGVKRLYFPTLDTAETNQGVAENLDGEEAVRLYGRVAVRNLTLVTSAGRRLKYVPTASFLSIFNSQEPRQQTIDSHVTVDAQYDRMAGRTRVAADLSFDRWTYDGLYPFVGETAAAPMLISDDSSVGVRWSGGLRATRPVRGRQTLTIGAELLANVSQNQTSTYRGAAVPWLASVESSNQTAIYLQDEIRVRPWLLLNGGIRHDRYEQFARTTPKAAVIVLPSANHSVKYLYGRAFRAPNAYELYYYPVVSDGGLRPESVGTHELAGEWYTGKWLRTSVSAYRSRASELLARHLIDADAVGFSGIAFFNRGAVSAKGLALEAEMRSGTGLHAAGSLVFQHAVDETRMRLTNSPRVMANFRFSTPGPVRHSIAALEVQHMSSRLTPAGTTVRASTVAHLTVSARAGRSIELFGTVRNLFDATYSDPASTQHFMDAIPQYGMTARIGLRWHLFPSRKP